MKTELLARLENPHDLEELYRTNKVVFKQEFNKLYPEIKGNKSAEFWHERLNYEGEEFSWGTSREFLFILIAALCAGLIAKLPAIFAISEDFFYPRNASFIILPALTCYFAWKNKLSHKNILVIATLFLTGLIFINLLPGSKSDTLTLSCIHLALFLWSLLGFAFVGGQFDSGGRRLGFLKYNGDLLIMTGLILIAGMILSGVTVGLFALIGFHIEKFYFSNIGLIGAASAPILATYFIQINPQLVGRVSPLIAKLFSPLVLIMLTAYLVAIVYSGKDPYNDREFLLIFNGLLVGVMAIIFFSVAEAPAEKPAFEIWVLFLLSVLTIIVNGIALSAILFRIAEWGITPNRAAVLGSNVLMLTNLFLVSSALYRSIAQKSDVRYVGNTIAAYLPVYLVWAVIVTFIFPLAFNFR